MPDNGDPQLFAELVQQESRQDTIPASEQELVEIEEEQEIIDELQDDADKSQCTLFDIGEWWKSEWQDMPECSQRDLLPFKSVIVHFETREDMEKFMQLTGQRLTMQTKSIWYPQLEISRFMDKRYIDEP